VDIRLSDDQEAIRAGVKAVCDRFDDDYWSACDTDKRFPFEFHKAMADGGWLGITMPEAFGGSNLGVTEAAIMMHEVTSSAGGYSAASALHLAAVLILVSLILGMIRSGRRLSLESALLAAVVSRGKTRPSARLRGRDFTTRRNLHCVICATGEASSN